MSLELDFGNSFGYLAAAYAFVAMALGGYLALLIRRERELDRQERERSEDGGDT